MADETERLLRELPAESPPPEIVLAAVRVFRYRAIAVAALAVMVAVLAVSILPRFLRPTTTDDEVAAVRRDGASQTLALEQDVQGIHVLLWEIVWGKERSFVHLQAWDPQGRALDAEVAGLTVGGRVVQPDGVGGGGGSSSEEGRLSFWEVYSFFPTPPAGAQKTEVAVRVTTGPGIPGGTEPVTTATIVFDTGGQQG